MGTMARSVDPCDPWPPSVRPGPCFVVSENLRRDVTRGYVPNWQEGSRTDAKGWKHVPLGSREKQP